MSKLFDDASLAMIPSAYKDGKLYSIRPTDGSGDFTFSRGSNLAATRVDVNGLIEKGRENLLLQSNQFDTTWNLTSGSSVTSGQSGYDGTNDAWLLTDSGYAGSYALYEGISNVGVLTASIYAKSASTNVIELDLFGSPSPYVQVNLTTGTITGTLNHIDAQSVDVGNGWWRISVTSNLSSTSYIRVGCDGAGSIYIQDAQLEQGLVATDYIETGTSAAQSGILEDMPRLDYSGSCPSLLLEPQRTNSVAQSEYFNYPSVWFKYSLGAGSLPIITNNYQTSPDGFKNATRLQLDAGGVGSADRSRLYINQSITSGTDYTFTFYAKSNTGNNEYIKPRAASVNYSEITITTEWKRFDVSFTANATGSFEFGFECRGNHTENSVDISIYGAQVEVGSYPTSYIPTYGSSVTRSNDFSSNINVLGTSYSSNDFTYFIEFDLLEDSADYTPMLFGGGNQALGSSYQGYLRIGLFGNDSIALFGHGDSIMDAVISPLTKDTRYKLLVKRSGTSIQFYLNGAQIGSTGTSSLDFTLRSVGWSYASGSYNTFGNIYQFLGFETALTDAECIALTTL